jgi:hypothetical protein
MPVHVIVQGTGCMPLVVVPHTHGHLSGHLSASLGGSTCSLWCAVSLHHASCIVYGCPLGASICQSLYYCRCLPVFQYGRRSGLNSHPPVSWKVWMAGRPGHGWGRRGHVGAHGHPAAQTGGNTRTYQDRGAKAGWCTCKQCTSSIVRSFRFSSSPINLAVCTAPGKRAGRQASVFVRWQAGVYGWDCSCLRTPPSIRPSHTDEAV